MKGFIESSIESRSSWMIHQFKYYGTSNPRNDKFQIWTNDNHPEICFTFDFMFSKLRYIHENPVRAGFVRRAEDYIYSSASNYAEMGGILDMSYCIKWFYFFHYASLRLAAQACEVRRLRIAFISFHNQFPFFNPALQSLRTLQYYVISLRLNFLLIL